MRMMQDLQLLLVFTIAFSMIALTGVIGTGPHSPNLPLTRALTLPPNTTPWYPAGSSMDKLVYQVYTDSTAEMIAFQNGLVDIPDAPISPSISSSICMSPNFTCTSPIMFTGYFELQFHLANNYWGCQMNFGNSACGKEIRQAIAHGLDKNVFVNDELFGAGVAIDNPVPSSVNLVSPNPCSWDATHLQSGPNCVAGGPGGTAYHLAPASSGSGCANTPGLAYTPGCGTPDFCAAADHFIASGIATGRNPVTCVLTGIAASITSNPVDFFVRSDDTARLHMGQSYVEFVCALLTGSFSLGCGISPSTNNLVTYTAGPLSSFPPFCVLLLACGTSWWVYTGGFGNIPTVDQSLYFIYNSRFASVPSSVEPPCSSLGVPTSAPSDYMFLCSPNHDALSTQVEFSPCVSSPGDPVHGQIIPTFANCPGTAQPTATSAAYQTQDFFGQNAFTIPVWTSANTFAYPSNWQRVVVHNGNGFIPPGNTFADVNAYTPTPAVPGTIRQGYTQSARSLNPFVAVSDHELGIIDNIWDSPFHENPSVPGSSLALDWMTVSSPLIPANQLAYVPPPGTIAAFRFSLRGDMFWQSGQRVTSWDLAFSYIALKATGAAGGVGLAPLTGIKVISLTQVDLLVSAVGPFTKLSLGRTIVIPGRFWSSCGSSTWDNGANTMSFAAANFALTPCIAPSSSVTSSGAILPNATSVDNSKTGPGYDPLAAGTLVGSGPWECFGSSLGAGCSSSNTEAVPVGGSYALQRYGLGTAPGSSLSTYFRSGGNLALWVWTGDTGDFTHDFLNFAVAARCFGQTPVPTNCSQWAMGIGNQAGSASSPATVGLVQLSIIARFVGVNWVSPYDWRTVPPQGIAVFPPVLYEGSVTLNPATLAGCNLSYNNGGGYDC